MVAKWRLEVEIAMGAAPVPISVSSRHFALRYEVPKFLARGGHLCMAVLTIAGDTAEWPIRVYNPQKNSFRDLAS